MVVLLPKMAMVSDCDGAGPAGIAAVYKERKRRFRQARLHYIQCFQVIKIHYSSVANSNSYFLFLLPPPPPPHPHPSGLDTADEGTLFGDLSDTFGELLAEFDQTFYQLDKPPCLHLPWHPD